MSDSSLLLPLCMNVIYKVKFRMEAESQPSVFDQK
jgi:hypothetical protein